MIIVIILCKWNARMRAHTQFICLYKESKGEQERVEKRPVVYTHLTIHTIVRANKKTTTHKTQSNNCPEHIWIEWHGPNGVGVALEFEVRV